MRIDSWDSAFVRARRCDVHAVLSDIDGYAAWWPRLDLRRGTSRWLLTHRRPVGWRRARTWVEPVKVRPDLGVDFALTGDLVGEGEWYYLDDRSGVLVHHLLRVQAPDRGGARVAGTYRASVRAALHVLKVALEGQRQPGDEPDADLVADQAEAAAAFRRGVERHQAKVAAGEAVVERGDGSGSR